MASEDNKKLNKIKSQAKYYEKHKDEINKKITCDICHGQFMKCNKSTHTKSQKHLDGIKVTELLDKLNLEIVPCIICGEPYTKKDKETHYKMRIHTDAQKIKDLTEQLNSQKTSTKK